MIKKFLSRSVFFIGWALSPFTAWNDVFVNIPLSYICANLVIRFIPMNFLTLVLVFYWMSNMLGIAMMYVAGKNILIGKNGIAWELGKLIVTMAVYSIILIILNKAEILNPL